MQTKAEYPMHNTGANHPHEAGAQDSALQSLMAAEISPSAQD